MRRGRLHAVRGLQPVYDDGCETNLDRDGAHCGACGHACEAGSCSAGVCRTPDARRLEVVLADQAVDVGAVEAGGLRGGGDVAAVPLEQAAHVLALAVVEPALAKLLERLLERDR